MSVTKLPLHSASYSQWLTLQVRTVATFVQKYDENGQLEIHEEPEASSCCRIKIEPMYHGMALSAEITGTLHSCIFLILAVIDLIPVRKPAI